MADIHPSREAGLDILAPAKINLTLEVLAERPDGFHEIRSVVQAMGLCDRLRFRPGPGTQLTCDNRDWDSRLSLVPRAISLIRGATGRSQGAAIDIRKRIPLLAGLGGDSSDAAATLLGLYRLWGLGLAPRELARLASQLGSDVPFFLHGGTALLEGRGEIVTPLPPLPRVWVVLLVPPVPRLPGKTARLYASLSASHYTLGEATEGLAEGLRRGVVGELRPSSLFNAFDATIEAQGLSEYRQKFLEVGAPEVHLAGSGPTLYTMVAAKALAEKIHQRLLRAGLESYLAETLGSS